jgi:hypothetical protein
MVILTNMICSAPAPARNCNRFYECDSRLWPREILCHGKQAGASTNCTTWFTQMAFRCFGFSLR